MKSAATVLEGRKGSEAIIKGDDDRLIVVRSSSFSSQTLCALTPSQTDRRTMLGA